MKEGVLFQQFLQQNRLSETLPAKAEHVSLYLCFLLDKRRASVVSTAYAALKWIHGLLPIAYNPLDSGLCKKLVDAERRQRPTPISKKTPTSLELIRQIIKVFAKEGATLKDLRTATMSVICFAGLFRAKELLNIRLCDIALHDDHIKIHIPYSKTDIYREGQDVFISRSNSSTCPGILLGRYLQHGSITLNSSKEYLFRNVIYLKSTKQYILGKRSVSYSRFRELFKDCLRQLGYDETMYSPHSFRAGGATEIVKNFPDVKSKERLLKIHGRWKSDIAKDMYIHEDIDERLAITKALKL